MRADFLLKDFFFFFVALLINASALKIKMQSGWQKLKGKKKRNPEGKIVANNFLASMKLVFINTLSK